MAVEISTVGAVVKWKVGTSRPTSGYTELANVNTAPSLGATPSTIDASNTKDGITRYIAGRIDPGGIQNLTLNMTSDGAALTDWAAIVTAYGAGASGDVWLEYKFAGLSQSFFIPIKPLPIKGDTGITQNSLKTVEAPFTVDGEPVWAASST